MSRDVLPVSVVLFVLLILVTGFSAQTGLHLQDGMYEVGVDDPRIAQHSFPAMHDSLSTCLMHLSECKQGLFDLIILQGTVYSSETNKADAAQNP